MDIVFIGAGRLATNMARAFAGKGHNVKAVYSRTMASASELSTQVKAMATDDISQLPLKADAFILSVKDDVLPKLITQLIQGRENQFFFHTAGSVPMSVFGAVPHHGVLYPMQTFSKERQVDFARVPIFIEGSDRQTQTMAHQLAETLSTQVFELSSEARRYLHLSAVFACNFSNHCYALSSCLLAKYGIPFSVMLPLIDETAEKVHTIAPQEAQTGPAVRYDTSVLNAQRAMLEDEPLMQQLYDLMSESIHKTCT